MTQDDAAGPSGSAEDIYGEFLRRRRQGEDVDIEEYCRRHPRLAQALRGLHSLDMNPPVDRSTVLAEEFDEAVARVPAREDDPATGPLRPGDRAGPYQVRQVLGEGGFAFVYRADQLQPVRRPVALKTIKLGLDTKQVIARFEAERQALALMSHSHIAKVYDAGVAADGRPYFVMEYVDGEPITDHCDRGNLSLEERLELFLLVCDAVQHAHQNAIIHRDIKPSNVLVTREGDRAVPKIIDFGIAKATVPLPTEETLFTQTGQIVGTPEYMSPEQVDAGAVDTRTDIYALGVLLYELLCGVRPFDPAKLRMAGFAELWRIIREDTPPRPSTRLTTLGGSTREIAARRKTTPQFLARSLRGDLDWIVMKSLAKKPDERYASASELAADLRRHLDAVPVLAGPPSLGYRLRKFAYRRRRSLVAALLVLVAATGAGFVVRRVDQERQREERITEGLRLLERGGEIVDDARSTHNDLVEFEETYEEAVRSQPGWRPIWERGAELESWDEFQERGRRLEDRYNSAFLEYTRALHLAPPGSEIYSRILAALGSLSEDVEASGRISVGTLLLKQQIESALAGEDVPESLPGDVLSKVRFSTEPTGAEVFVFRYEESEKHLLPLAYVPPRGEHGERGEGGRVVGKPFLEVQKTWDAGLAKLSNVGSSAGSVVDAPDGGAFRPGDRLLVVNGKPVATRGDLAGALRGVKIDEVVPIKLRREGSVLSRAWMPFPKTRYEEPDSRFLEPGRLTSIREQLGLTFEGYPLDFRDDCRIGVTATQRDVSVELPLGSYLFVFRKDGYSDVRYPLRVREQRDVSETVRLLEPEAIPEGFVYIPAGPFTAGGPDRDYLQNLEYGDRYVDGFFMDRFEITVAQYLEFLNDPAIYQNPVIAPRSPEARAAFQLLIAAHEASTGQRPEKFDLRPVNEATGKPLVSRDQSGRWGPVSLETASTRDPTEAPLIGVSCLAAMEYAHWRTETDPDGWVYRIPNDEQWEKAARGADARIFVWGDYMVWSFSWTKNGNWPGTDHGAPFPGIRPLDESVFGVRDLMGSAREPTSGQPKWRRRYVAMRGGAWEAEDTYEFRTDTRIGIPPERRSRTIGIRLVAEMRRK